MCLDRSELLVGAGYETGKGVCFGLRGEADESDVALRVAVLVLADLSDLSIVLGNVGG